jgi:glycosyltransferase involved in cell wall biosynthesis
MRILIATPSQGHYGGIEAFVIALASAVEQWPECEVQVAFKLVRQMELREDLQKGAGVLRCPVHYFPSGNRKLLQLTRWADLVHGQNASPDIVFPAVLMRRRLVLTMHNWRRPDRDWRSRLWGIGAKLADRRWYNSRFVWDTWEPQQKSRNSDCVPTVCRFPEGWCPPAQRKGFLFIGRWIENKGIEELVEAYARAKLDPAQWPLTLVGDGPLQAKVHALIKQLGVRGVKTPGFIDDKEKSQRLASARWLVAPARTREDLGLTPIEARSVGVPVIVSRDGGLPEAAGADALIVEPGNVEELAAALRQAATMSEQEYEGRAARGRETLKDFLRPMEFYRESYRSLGPR